MSLDISGENIARKRKELKLSQEELAKILGLTRRTIGNYENGGVIPEARRELLRSFIYGDVAGSNINVAMNHGNIAGNNMIQISLPEEGTQKIIKPDGTTIIEALSSKGSGNQSKELDPDNKSLELQSTIDMQKKLIESLEGTIKAQQQTIELLSAKKE